MHDGLDKPPAAVVAWQKKNMKYCMLLLALALFTAGCQKEISGETPQPAPPPVNDRQSLLVKEITDDGLPAPYFHFTYDDSSYVKQVRFADGLLTYDYTYSGGRISKATNIMNGETLTYSYQDQLVHQIESRQSDGTPVWTYLLGYSGNRLASVRYMRIKSAADSIEERRVTFSYDANGNLSTYKDYWRNNAGVLALSRTFIYSDYDNGLNVDGFYLYKNFFENLLFLPGIRLQQNNPRQVDILGSENDYRITYTYTYQDQRPLAKTGTMVQTRGNGAGQPVQLHSSYSYY